MASLRRRTELLHESGSVTAGRFSCPAEDASWAEDNIIGRRPHLVFATRPVDIRQEGHRRICVDRHRAVLYDGGRIYQRQLVHPAGDRADFVAVAPTVVREALTTHRVPTADTGSFGVPVVPLSESAFLAQRLLFRDLARGDVDNLDAEERLLRLVDLVIAPCGTGTPARSRRGHADLAEAAVALLSNDLGAPLGLTEIGARLNVSAFHLARVFRAQTGSSLHSYREGERLRAAVDESLAAPRSLSRIATDLGFSSHSHLSKRFRHRFGATPSDIVRRSA